MSAARAHGARGAPPVGSGPVPPALPRWLDRVLKGIDPERNPSATVYGTLAVGLMLAAEDPAQETYPRVCVATLATVVAYWLAHAYAAWLGGRLRGAAGAAEGHPVRQFVRFLGREFALVEGSLVPIVVLLVAWSTGAALATAVGTAIWAAAGVVLAVELAAGIRRGLSLRQLLGNALVGGSLAVLLFAVKSVLH